MLSSGGGTPPFKYCLSLDFQLIFFHNMWGQVSFVQTSCNQTKDVGDSGYRRPQSATGSMSIAGVCNPHHLPLSLLLEGETELSADSLSWTQVPSWWSENQSQPSTHSGST